MVGVGGDGARWFSMVESKNRVKDCECSKAKQLFKAKILFEINNPKEFYQTFQISKNNRIKLNDIYLEIEQNLNSNNFNINKFLINSKFINNSLKEKDVKDLTDKYNIDEIQNVKNWIELKKFANQIFSEIN